jgi:hypothetical protein
MRCYEFPLFIPRASQIKAKLQALIASDTVVVMMELWGGGEQNGWAGVGVECVGASVAASQGTSVTPGTVSEGTFTAIGTTVREWKYILPMTQGILTDSGLSNPLISVDIGVDGAVYQELEEFWFHMNATEASAPAMGGRGRFAIVPSGTALQLRSQASSATVEPSDFCIYGVY